MANSSGAISGAAAGATVGTAVLPGIGTAVGAIGGAIFGAFGSNDSGGPSSSDQLRLQREIDQTNIILGGLKLKSDQLSAQTTETLAVASFAAIAVIAVVLILRD